MQPQVKLAVVCDYAMASQDGKLSIIGMFGQLNVMQLPSPSPPFFAVAVLLLDPGTYNVRFGMVDPSGQQVIPAEAPTINVEVQGPGTEAPLWMPFNGLPLSRAGIYQVQTFVDGRLLHSIPVNVQVLTPEAMGQLQG
jgi:hypothetical protein